MGTESNILQLSDKAYDSCKKFVQIVLPALSSLYFGIASVWGLPETEKVIGTLAILATFLGTILGISTRSYKRTGAAYDGAIKVLQDPGGVKKFSLELDGDPELLPHQESVTFKIDTLTFPDEDISGQDAQSA